MLIPVGVKYWYYKTQNIEHCVEFYSPYVTQIKGNFMYVLLILNLGIPDIQPTNASFSRQKAATPTGTSSDITETDDEIAESVAKWQ